LINRGSTPLNQALRHRAMPALAHAVLENTNGNLKKGVSDRK
jgi:hypothetical protein